MAIIDNPILRGLRGKLGEFVVYQCRGKTCLRMKADREKMKFSSGQLAQQERVASAAMFYRAAKAIGLHRHWQKAAAEISSTGYNLFMQHNLPAFTGEGLICDFAKLGLSTGSLPLPDKMNIYRGEGEAWIMEWENGAPYPGARDDDRLAIALMKREDVFTIKTPDIGDWRRKHCRAVIHLPPELNDYTHLYGYFCSAAGETFSVSRYFNINHKN